MTHGTVNTAKRTRASSFAVLNATATGKRRTAFDAQSARGQATSAKHTALAGRNRQPTRSFPQAGRTRHTWSRHLRTYSHRTSRRMSCHTGGTCTGLRPSSCSRRKDNSAGSCFCKPPVVQDRGTLRPKFAPRALTRPRPAARAELRAWRELRPAPAAKRSSTGAGRGCENREVVL